MADTVNLFLVSISVGLIYFICFTESLGAVIQSEECGTGVNFVIMIASFFVISAKLNYSFDVTKRGPYDLFSKAHQNRYEDIPGENNPYIADWLAYGHEKTLKHEGIFDKYDEPEED
ncbi:hypothetical protein CAEBREN_13093 [Caenorhabditis brenneri]|uniref:Uncharacterized protein n=1 Tax=Caenorhabditis brenneri TaxID=135651 RepID=G0P102_CAEBE|nr:hypothetical protein CAEBREN_13093 [Caenorhabditis brenneri]